PTPSPPPPPPPLLPYTTLFRSAEPLAQFPGLLLEAVDLALQCLVLCAQDHQLDALAVAADRAFVKVGAGLGELRLHDSEQAFGRSEEHTSELQSRSDLVCRLLL